MTQNELWKWSVELRSLASECRESRGAHLPALLLSFISHIYTSMLTAHAVTVREWCTAAGGISILPWHPPLTTSSKNRTVWKAVFTLCKWAIRGSTFFGTLHCGATAAAGSFFQCWWVQMECLQPGCEEKKCHRGLCICCWCMRLASMHYSKIGCSKDDVPDSSWRMDCHHELSQLAVSLNTAQIA